MLIPSIFQCTIKTPTVGQNYSGAPLRCCASSPALHQCVKTHYQSIIKSSLWWTRIFRCHSCVRHIKFLAGTSCHDFYICAVQPASNSIFEFSSLKLPVHYSWSRTTSVPIRYVTPAHVPTLHYCSIKLASFSIFPAFFRLKECIFCPEWRWTTYHRLVLPNFEVVFCLHGAFKRPHRHQAPCLA